MLEKDRYTYRVTWSEEDGEYVGLCAEFPSLSWRRFAGGKHVGYHFGHYLPNATQRRLRLGRQPTQTAGHCNACAYVYTGKRHTH